MNTTTASTIRAIMQALARQGWGEFSLPEHGRFHRITFGTDPSTIVAVLTDIQDEFYGENINSACLSGGRVVLILSDGAIVEIFCGKVI